MENKSIILSSGTNQEASEECAESKCLAHGKCKLLLNCSRNATRDQNIAFSTQAE